MKKTLLFLALSVFTLIPSTFSQTNITGTISSNTNWTIADSPYNVIGNITVNSGIILTIEPGVTINYNGNFRIQVKGGIVSIGTVSNPIIFNGNTIVGIEKMILFRNANFNNSSFNYCNFNGPQNAIQLGDESSGAEDSPKNSGTLAIENANFINSGLLTKGWFTNANLNISNSNFSNCTIKSENYSEFVTLNNCSAERTTFNYNNNAGYKIYSSLITNSFFNINGSWQSPSLLIETSKIYNSPFSGYEGPVVINKSIIVDSPLNLSQNNIDITNSVISFDGAVIITGIFTRKATISNSIISGRGAGTGIEINGISQSAITNSLFTDNNKGIRVQGSSGTFDFQSNNFIKNKTFAIENLTTRYIDAPNNFWDAITETEIENLIYHYNDDDTKGTVTYTPFLSSYQTNTLTTPPNNVAKKQVGSDVVLTWTPNIETSVTGYKLYYGDPTGLSYSNMIDLGNVNTYTIIGGSLATEYALTAYNANITGANDQIIGFESWFSVAKDPKVSLSFSGEVINEKSGKVNVFAQLSTALPYATTIDLSFTGTATKGVDYQTATEKIIIPAGSTSNFLELTILEDQDVELTETIVIEISAADNATIDSVQKITMNLENSNQPIVSLAVSKISITEKENFMITATINNPISKDIVIGLESVGSAIYDRDFTSNTEIIISTVAGGNGPGYNANQLYSPNSVFIDSQGNTYVGDWNNGRIQKWKPGATAGETVISGLNGHQMDFDINDNGTIYVMEHGNHRVIKYVSGDITGVVVAGVNGQGPAANQLSYPRGIFVDDSGNIFIADSDNHRIQKWAPGATEGITVAGGNGPGNNANQLNSPFAVDIDSDGNMYIADSNNYRIQKWTPGAITGTTIVSSTMGNEFYATDIYVNDYEAIYIADESNHRILRFAQGSNVGVVVAGGNGAGNAPNQLSSPRKFFVNPVGNIYIADLSNNRVQKYQTEPQIIINAGETTVQLTVSGIEDTLDELDETIILNATSINAVLGNSDPISVNLTDINEPPTVAFTFSQPKIVENSQTDVTLTATLSNVSAKDIDIQFVMEGSAIETKDYVVSSKTISIPANTAKGTLSISTKDIDDALVEVLDSIVFRVATITNATSVLQTASLLLESDDDPTVTLTFSKDTIAEHESSIITATLDAATSKDVIINFSSTGIAKYDLDFTTDFVGKGDATIVAGGNGQGGAANQLYYLQSAALDKDGNLYTLELAGGSIKKWIPGATEGSIIVNGDINWNSRIFIDQVGSIYISQPERHLVQKWIVGGTNWTTVAGGNGQGSAANQLNYPQGIYVDNVGNVFVADQSNHRIQKWAVGATTGITVAGGNGQGAAANQLNNPNDVSITKDGTIYVLDQSNSRIQKWTVAASAGTTITYLNSWSSSFSVDESGNIFVVDPSYYRVQKWSSGGIGWSTVAGGNSQGSETNQLNNPVDISIDTEGNIYVADAGNYRVLKYQYSPKLIIKAGDTEAVSTVKGIEDELNNEGNESIILEPALVQNALLSSTDSINITLLDNTKALTLKENPFMGLSNGAVAWGDYDRDGDQDVAIMGQSPTGAVTAVFENQNGKFVNTNQNFAKLYGGDISWVDINKDGWIDLVVSGFNGTPQTKVYLNNEGQYFDSTNNYGLPQLASSKMAWGDLDNDGDIDLAISGLDAQNNYVFKVYYREDGKNNFVVEPLFNYPGFINGDLKMVDYDLDGDNDIIFNGETKEGSPTYGIIYNSYVKTTTNNDYYSFTNLNLKNSSIELNRFKNTPQNKLSIISTGEDSNGNTQLFTYPAFYESTGGMAGGEAKFPKLKNGDISVGDFDNDGLNDIIFTGEDQQGNPVTQLFLQDKYGNFKDSELQIKGLRKSTVNWVDYDMDGDLDLFLTGLDVDGAKTILYESAIVNKKNLPPSKITGLIATDLGNGKMRLSWDIANDDFSSNLGYVVRLGITPGGTELSNTESDLTTGGRLITKPAPIYTNFFETQLDPGNYYWSVQAVDTGLKGGEFSDEDSFTLTYEWKILNQGGIVDKSILGVKDPVIKLADIDNDSDLDLIYGSESSYGVQLLKFNGKQLIRDNSYNSLSYMDRITNAEVGDINGDGVSDILINRWVGSAYGLKLFLSNSNGYTEIEVGEGLYKAKAKIVDLNNDGQAEIVLVGMSNGLISGLPKFLLYKYSGGAFIKTDISNQIDVLKNGSFDLGDFDNDQDIDFIISGYHDTYGFQSFIYENTTVLGGDFTLTKTANNLVAVGSGTTDFIDYDGDGDLDAVFTGESAAGDVFEIYINKLNEGSTTWPRFSSGLTPMREGKIDLGDFNGDGYSDILYSGVMTGLGDVTKLSEYNPIAKNYVNSSFDVSDIIKAEVEFGDLDGDGDLDFVITGQNIAKTEYIFRTYINVRNQSAQVVASKSALKKPAYAGKSSGFAEKTFIVNVPPSVPIPNDIVFLQGDNTSVDIPLEFSWQAATDDHTPTPGLTYAIKIGTTAGGEEIMSANSNDNGIKKEAGKGNVEHNLLWKLSLPEGTYYWSVQAVDASYSGSEFTTPVQFKVTAAGIDSDSDGDGIDNALDKCPETPKGDAVDQNGCSVNALLGDSNGDASVNVMDLVLNVDYILGNNPIPFVFKAADVNNDNFINVLDIVGTVDIILNQTSGKNNNSKEEWNYYSNNPIDEALFYWEGNDLYVSSDKAIAGMQLVFDTDFDYEISEKLSNFDLLNFKKEADKTIMIYSFNGISIEPGKTKLLTKFDNTEVSLNVEKSAAGTPKGMKLTVKFEFKELITPTESFKLGPNPSNGLMTLYHYLPEERDLLHVKAYNLNGALVWSSEAIKSSLGQGSNPINLEFLNDGVYFIVIEAFKQGETKEREVKHIIIRK